MTDTHDEFCPRPMVLAPAGGCLNCYALHRARRQERQRLVERVVARLEVEAQTSRRNYEELFLEAAAIVREEGGRGEQ